MYSRCFHWFPGPLAPSVCSSPEGNGEAGQNHGIFGIVGIEFLAYLGEVFYCPGFLLLPSGLLGRQFVAGLKEGVDFIVVYFLLGTIDDVPCSDAVYIVLDGATAVGAGKGQNEAGEDNHIDGGTMFFFDAFVVTEDVEHQEACSICALCVRCIGFLEYFLDPD